MILDRRGFIGVSGAALLLSACKANAPNASLGKSRLEKIGLQTYTLREALVDDFVGTLKMVKAVGYDYVELNGRDFADRSPQDLRTILDDVGLPSPISHVDYDSLANRPEHLAEVANVLGLDYVVLPWIGDDQRGRDDYKRHAEMLNKAADRLRPAGVGVGYHNHQFEFFDLGAGETGMEILLSETDPAGVTFELDLFWAALAGVDIPALFRRHPGRFKMCHVKDLSGDSEPWRTSLEFPEIVQKLMVNVGEGQLPFETYFAENSVSGLEYFIAEHDNPPKPFRQSIQTSHDAMRALRF
ncbi:MAG: sugar phosphate isomerase/epimerase [Pseudomonadota bacterium]